MTRGPLKRTLWLALIATAIVAAVVPYPAGPVERLYTHGAYARLQPVLTSASNAVPVALLDVAVLVGTVFVLFVVIRSWRRRGPRAGIVHGLGWLVRLGVVVYLLFMATWGLNYRRVPLENRLSFDRTRVDVEGARALASRAVSELNAGYRAAHERPVALDRLQDSLRSVLLLLGAPRAAHPASPKTSLAQLYFRQAAIDGMTVPIFLEVILHPDLLPVEVPFVLAHEQAHLAGFADESEASFVAWVATVRSDDPVTRYSGWLDIYGHAASALSRDLRATLPLLDEGPREDIRQIRARVARASPAVRNAAREVYDSYLKANRIEEGIENYGRVLQLVLGTEFDEGWRPRLRAADPD